MTARVTKIESRSGYCFLHLTEGAVFLHQSSLKNAYIENLTLGQSIEFDLTQTPKGLRAENAYLLG